MAAEQPVQDELTLAKQRIGTVVAGKWSIEKLIGLGGMAAVYLSHDEAGGPVAIKILHGEFATNDGVRMRFIREAKLTQAVDHSGRVEIYDEGVSEDNEPYFVMEMLEGVTLDKLWKRHNRVLPIEYALEITDRILDFLSVCHERNIVHRDLKPANIFVTDSGYVKVLDFGVARLREAGVDPTLAGTALGTPAYMAPEQALGSNDRIDARTDLFSIGAVLHALVSGKRLHEGRSHQEAFVLAATRPAPSVARSNPELPPDVVALVDRSLQWDPRNRFQNAQEMRDEIARVLEVVQGVDAAPKAAEQPQKSPAANQLAALAAQDAPEQKEEPLTPEERQLILDLTEAFKHIERALTAVRQYTWEHPVTAQHIANTTEVISQCLARHPEDFRFDVKPHSFTKRGVVLWEPLHPFDEIPYNLFASGFRQFTLLPGLDGEELRNWLELVRMDPYRDFSPEDDMATAFWEKGLTHVQYKVVMSFLALNASDEAARQYEALLEDGHRILAEMNRRRGDNVEPDEPMDLEEKAASIAARQVALRAVRASGALSLDERSKTAIAAAMDMPEHEWEARFVDTLADAANDAVTFGNLMLAAVPLSGALHENAANHTLEFAMRMVVSVAESVSVRAGAQVREELVRSVLDGETLAMMLKELTRKVPDSEHPALVRCAPFLAVLLEDIDSRSFDIVLAALTRADVDEIRSALLRYLEKHAIGKEEAIGELLDDADLARGKVILGLLGRLKTEAAAAALRKAELSPYAELRVEAVAMRAAANMEGLRDELGKLMTDPDQAVRMAALRTLVRYKVKEAGPPLALHIQSAAFHRLTVEERQLFFETLCELSPARGEALLKDLVSKTGMFTREDVDDTRILAMNFLARMGRSRDVLEVLEQAAGKWGNSQAVKNAAQQAAAQLKSRLGAR
ncbi:MAG: protein kinase [Myxococcales bacterium]|nr:protein kinase [Myxococcales bacterium]